LATRATTGAITRIEAAERHAQVIALRRRRLGFADIGKALGISATRAWQIYQDAIAAIPSAELDAHRRESLVMIDDAINDLLKIAENHNAPRTAVEAWNSIRGWEERKAKLLGLDAKVEVAVSGHVTYDIAGVDMGALQ
jgi:hypothetical protein